MKEKTAQFLQVPKELFAHLPKVTWIGLHEVTIENCGLLLLCEENRVQFGSKIGILSLDGTELVIREIIDNIAVLGGTVTSVTYL